MSLIIQNLCKEFKNLQKKTDKTEHQAIRILHNLNLSVKAAEIVAIVGASGSGKSTFLSLVSGLDKVDSGKIEINGHSIDKMNAKELIRFRSENIGIIFQQFHLISHLTALENLALPLEILGKNPDENYLLSKLEEVGLAHRAQHQPSQLSGGECQRLALARGLIVNPKLILADEPSGNLDSETGEKIMNLFFNQVRNKKTITVLVTHDMKLAEKCDVIYKLQKGQLVEYP